MSKFIMAIALSFFFTLGSSHVLANHCSGGHDSATETSTGDSKETEKDE